MMVRHCYRLSTGIFQTLQPHMAALLMRDLIAKFLQYAYHAATRKLWQLRHRLDGKNMKTDLFRTIFF